MFVKDLGDKEPEEEMGRSESESQVEKNPSALPPGMLTSQRPAPASPEKRLWLAALPVATLCLLHGNLLTKSALTCSVPLC